MKVAALWLAAVSGATVFLSQPLPVLAATPPPVRLSLVAADASGMEQEVMDRVTDQLQSNTDLKISTVNPDWYGIVKISDTADAAAMTVRVNGTLTIKTRDGHVINTVSVQSNKQDFSLSPGTPINKGLINQACEEVISKLVERAVNPVNDAVQIEIDTRGKLLDAHDLADNDRYKEALDILRAISQDTPHYQESQALIAQYELELAAAEKMNSAKASARAGKLAAAIATLKEINSKSKRYPQSRRLIAQYNAQLVAARRNAAAAHASHPSSSNVDERVQLLEAQKKFIDAQEALLREKKTNH